MKLARILCIIAGVFVPACSARANYLQFQNPTDTISVAGNTVLPNENQLTIEAIVDPTSIDFAYSTGSGGYDGAIYDAWEYGAQDTHMFLDNSDNLSAYAFPINWQTPLEGGTVPLNNWLDLAYVYDGSEEWLYIDGSLVASRPAKITLGLPYPQNGDLSVGSGSAVSIGAADLGGIVPAFIGSIQSLRISDVGRYSGDSYAASMSDFTDDPSTILLYDFDRLSPGATSIPDLSGNGHTGTFGVGFAGATSPTIVVVPEPSCIGLLVLLPLISSRRKKLKSTNNR